MFPTSKLARTTTFASLLALALLAGTATSRPLQTPDLSTLVFVGDSLSAGYQNGSLHEDYQPNGFAAWIAYQAGSELPLPLIAAPGIPATLYLVDEGPPPIIRQASGQSTGRIDMRLQTLDLGVPGHNTQDALTTRPNFPIDDMTDLVLGMPGLFFGVSKSQVEWAEALDPTVVFVWLGNNDTLGAALYADATLATPVDQFRVALAEVMDRMSATGALVVVANVPDVTVIPYLTSTEELVESIDGLTLDLAALLLGIFPGDYVIPAAFPLIAEILQGNISGPLPDSVVLTAAEVATLRSITADYNEIIRERAASLGAVHVDIHTVLGRMDDQGLLIEGRYLDTSFLGGVFSLDGIHPTNTGYAAVANAFIHAMNTQAGTTLPLVDLAAVLAGDPLAPGPDGPGGGNAGQLAGAPARALQEVLARR